MKLDRVIAVRNDKTIYREDGKCIKVFGENFTKQDILNEALNQSRIEETGLRIPGIHEVTSVDGRWTIVSDYIQGKTLEQMMKDEPEKLDEYMEFFVNLHLEIFEKKCPVLGRLKDKLNRKIKEADLNATTRFELHTRLNGMPKHKKICHGDFNPSNIIIDKNGDCYIIDWSHVSQGNAEADVAITYLYFLLKGEKELGEKYLELYCEKSNTGREYVEYWMPIIAAAQSTHATKKDKAVLLQLTKEAGI